MAGGQLASSCTRRPALRDKHKKTKSIVYCATIVGFAAEIDLGLKDGFMLLMNEGGPS